MKTRSIVGAMLGRRTQRVNLILRASGLILTLVILATALPFASVVAADATGEIPPLAWDETCGGTGRDMGNWIEETADGNYIMAGSLGSGSTGASDAWLVKMNPSGGQIWTQQYDISGSQDQAFCVQQTVDSGYIMAGVTGPGVWDAVLIKTDALGNKVKHKVLPETLSRAGSDVLAYVHQTPDGGFVAAGGSNSWDGSGYWDCYLVKTDGDLNVQWERRYHGSWNEEFLSMDLASDGGYIMVGWTESSELKTGAGADALVIKTDANGNVGAGYPGTFQKTYSAGGNNFATDVRQLGDGSYIVTGNANMPGTGTDFYLMKLDALGTKQWGYRYGTVGYDHPVSLDVTDDGGYVMAGCTDSALIANVTGSTSASNLDFYLVKTDSNGSQIDTAVIGGPGYDFAECVRQTSDGSYIAAGRVTSSGSLGAGDFDAYVVKYAGPSSLSGLVWKDEDGDNVVDYVDTNGNGSWDVGEQMDEVTIPGVTVEFVADYSVVASATTDEHGRYTVAGLTDRGYEIRASYKVDGKETISAATAYIYSPTLGPCDVKVEYVAVNYAPADAQWELWHEGPVFPGQQSVITVPGYLLSGMAGDSDCKPNDFFGQMDDLLQRKRHGQYNVWQFEYARHYSFSTYANWLSAAILRTTALGGMPGVNLITHSHGGLVARQYLESSGADRSGKLLTIAAPHYGTEWGSTDFWAVDARELRPGSRFLWDLNTSWDNMGTSFAAIGGVRSGASDGVVNVSSASLVTVDYSQTVPVEQREFFWTQDYGHLTISVIPDSDNNGDPDEKSEMFTFIVSFLQNGSGSSGYTAVDPGDYGGSPYVSFCLKERPADISNYPRVTFVQNGRVYSPGHGTYTRGEFTADGEIIYWFKAGKDDYGQIIIESSPFVQPYLGAIIHQGQSTVISQPVDNTGYGNTTVGRVEPSITPISAGNGGFAVAGTGQYSNHSIVIPAGSLGADTSIIISEPSDSHGLNSAVEFGPDGTVFAVPATITVEYKDSDIPDGLNESSMKLLVWEEGEWKMVQGNSVDMSNNTVSGNVSHLSLYAAGYAFAPEVVSCDSAGNQREQFAPGQSVYVKGTDLEPNTVYRIWLQEGPIAEGDLVVNSELGSQDPSGEQEQVTTDENGDFGPMMIWEGIPEGISYHEYDIVIDKQDDGENTGRYNSGSDGIDSVAAVGFTAPVPELAALLLFGTGLFMLGGLVIWTKRRAAA